MVKRISPITVAGAALDLLKTADQLPDYPRSTKYLSEEAPDSVVLQTFGILPDKKR